MLIDVLLIGSVRRVFRLTHPLWYRYIIYEKVKVGESRIWDVLGIWWGTRIIHRWCSVKLFMLRDDSHSIDKTVYNIDKYSVLTEEKILFDQIGCQEERTNYNLKSFITLMKVISMHSGKMIEVNWFLKIVVSWDPDVQTIYFACTPSNIRERDEDLLLKGRMRELWDLISMLWWSPHATTPREKGCPRENTPKEGDAQESHALTLAHA